MNTSFKSLIAFVAAASVLVSCESNHFFKSEKKLKGDIIGTWEKIPFTISDVRLKERWIFSDGDVTIISYAVEDSILYDSCIYNYPALSIISCNDSSNYYNDIVRNDGVDTIVIDKGSYVVDATVAAPFLKIEGLRNFVSPFYNSKWTIVQLDSKVLDIATDYPDNTGVLQREFLKQ